jgi:hypothetical protein
MFILINTLMIVLTSQMLIDAAEEIRPVGRVEVFYSNSLPSLETFDLVSDLLADYQGIYDVDYYSISDPWPERLLSGYGLEPEEVFFAVMVNGTDSALINDDTVAFLGLPACMHGSGNHEGDWALGDLQAVLWDNDLLVGAEEDPLRGSEMADRIIHEAISYLGTPYVWGGTDENGFDCSGLAYRVFNDNGIPLPRTVGAIEDMGVPVEREDLRPGDILVFDNPRHTGIYIGNGEFIHCSSWQDRGVVITEITQSNYARRYSGAVRILGTGEDY